MISVPITIYTIFKVTIKFFRSQKVKLVIQKNRRWCLCALKKSNTGKLQSSSSFELYSRCSLTNFWTSCSYWVTPFEYRYRIIWASSLLSTMAILIFGYLVYFDSILTNSLTLFKLFQLNTYLGNNCLHHQFALAFGAILGYRETGNRFMLCDSFAVISSLEG